MTLFAITATAGSSLSFQSCGECNTLCQLLVIPSAPDISVGTGNFRRSRHRVCWYCFQSDAWKAIFFCGNYRAVSVRFPMQMMVDAYTSSPRAIFAPGISFA